MFMETHEGSFLHITLERIKRMTRSELVTYLELRGHACYDNETTNLLRECAIEDWEGEV